MADRYGTVVVSNDPRGRYQECLITATPKPGTCMTVLAATEPVNGIFTYEAFNRDADGDNAEIAVLVEDELQGRDITTAYVAATQGRMYFPLPGDFLQMLVLNIAGTSDSFAIGDLMIVNDGDGKLIATTGSPESEPFRIMETIAAITADTIVLCQYTGH